MRSAHSRCIFPTVCWNRNNDDLLPGGPSFGMKKKTQTARKDWNFRATSTKIIKICIHKIIDTLWKTRRVAHKNGSPCINYMNHWIWTELICKCNFKNANCKCKHTFTWNATAVALLLLPFLQMLYNSSYQFHM